MDEKILDNRWVVPYNPLLSTLLDCHVNVEACTGITLVKYLFKYVTNGPDRCVAELRSAEGEAHDEVKQYLDARQVYICCPCQYHKLLLLAKDYYSTCMVVPWDACHSIPVTAFVNVCTYAAGTCLLQKLPPAYAVLLPTSLSVASALGG